MRTALLSAFLIILFCAGFAAAADSPETSREEAATLLSRAEDTFRRAAAADGREAADLYQRAAVMYEQIINESQISNPGLYYNLGNCYLMSDDIGRAILNYRRAQRLDSSDPQIHKNLQYALSKRVDKIEVRVERRVLSRLLFWHYDFSLRSRFTAAVISYAVLMLLIAARLLFANARWTVPAAGLVFVIFICLAGSAAVEHFGIGASRTGVILADSVTARQGNGENYPESFSEPLHEGTEFELLEKRIRWAHIRLFSGDDAWIPISSFELVDG
ncbi:hypothetical protein SMSP2_02556 [Limihaloglobus sulfuriphilus]|uniref:Uncharacterized protein n=1 Tax=Limihaloglobus sulfuriphilus TaxID=1851148 RepID=A0A1Q2MHI7_9BACT|nr:hypothetical protein [Limihaloglobus sulfuriphilus]AQQ72175.1 hypothetical protein SMSP2_02556 [Limihaloglobus sulfuriphilus]